MPTINRVQFHLEICLNKRFILCVEFDFKETLLPFSARLSLFEEQNRLELTRVK